jgi:hypothetical protein
VDAQASVAVRDLVALENLDRVHTHAGEAGGEGAAQPRGLDGVGACR